MLDPASRGTHHLAFQGIVGEVFHGSPSAIVLTVAVIVQIGDPLGVGRLFPLVCQVKYNNVPLSL